MDEQAEQVIREKILAAFPAAYRGEETGSATGGDKEHFGWSIRTTAPRPTSRDGGVVRSASP